MTDCCNKERQRSKTLSSLCATVTDDVLKLGYTSVIFLDMGVKVDGTYYCDLLVFATVTTVTVADCHTSCL